MNTEEAFAICRMAKGAFPATSMDEFTPDAWALALEDDKFEDCKEALKQLMREQTFIHVSEIVKRVAIIRNERVLAYGVINPPADLDPDDYDAYNTWFVTTKKAIADGELTNANPQLPTIRGPWTADQERAVAAARMKTIRAEVAKRKPEPRENPALAATKATYDALPGPGHTPPAVAVTAEHEESTP